MLPEENRFNQAGSLAPSFWRGLGEATKTKN